MYYYCFYFYFYMDMYTIIVFIHYISFYVCKCIWVYNIIIK